MAMPEDKQEDDQISRINKEYNELHNQDGKSNVMPGWKPPSENPIEPEQPEVSSTEEKRSAVLGLIQDSKNQREEIDRLNQSMEYVAGKMTEMAQIMDAQTKVINNMNQNPSQSGNGGVDPKQFLGELLQSPIGERLLDKLMPSQSAAPPIIDNNIIQEKMKQTFFDNLETGESINNFIKNSLKKTVTKNVINTSLGEIGKFTGQESNQHGPA